VAGRGFKAIFESASESTLLIDLKALASEVTGPALQFMTKKVHYSRFDKTALFLRILPQLIFDVPGCAGGTEPRQQS
jgi:hypothetical protein